MTEVACIQWTLPITHASWHFNITINVAWKLKIRSSDFQLSSDVLRSSAVHAFKQCYSNSRILKLNWKEYHMNRFYSESEQKKSYISGKILWNRNWHIMLDNRTESVVVLIPYWLVLERKASREEKKRPTQEDMDRWRYKWTQKNSMMKLRDWLSTGTL